MLKKPRYLSKMKNLKKWIFGLYLAFLILGGTVGSAFAGGSVNVTIDPPEAITAGAQWRLNVGLDTGWKDSGETISNVPTGIYRVVYKRVNGWLKPVNERIEVTEGSAYTTAGTYVALAPGSVNVTIDPPEAITAGAQWRLNVGLDTGWKDSGETISNVPTGIYRVVYKRVNGWLKPVNERIEVTEGSLIATGGTYVLLPILSEVSDVKWGIAEYSPAWYEGLVQNNISTLYTGDRVDPVGGYIDPSNGTISLSFSLASLTSGMLEVTVEIYSAIGNTMDEDVLVRTLINSQSVTLDLDPIEGYSKYFENFVDWDGRDDNGAVVPIGFYKVKVSTQEATSWDETYELSEELKIIPRRFLRNPFVPVPTEAGPPYYDVIGSDQEKGIISGLYPAYVAPDQNDFCGECMINCNFYGEADNKCKLYFFEKLKELGLTELQVGALWDDLKDKGYISENSSLMNPFVSNDFCALNSFLGMDLFDDFGLREEIWEVLKQFRWWGHCYGWNSGMPMLEGPIDHGMHEDSLNYFEGEWAGVCYCDEPGNYPAGECGSCSDICGAGSGHQICGFYGNGTASWGNGDSPVREDLHGFIYAPVPGNYKFRLYADDEGTLSVGGILDIVNSEKHLTELGYYLREYNINITGGALLGTANAANGNTFEAEINLEEGYYPIEVNFENSGGQSALRLYWNLKDADNQNFLFIDPTFIQKSQEDSNAYYDFLNNPVAELQ
ncbi:MAG: hypothetical protein K8S27_16360 [Candidatus Omnitrophica bacterium]|nr:hypothetical protein [Candidatus Omnitrophota bacterium]